MTLLLSSNEFQRLRFRVILSWHAAFKSELASAHLESLAEAGAGFGALQCILLLEFMVSKNTPSSFKFCFFCLSESGISRFSLLWAGIKGYFPVPVRCWYIALQFSGKEKKSSQRVTNALLKWQIRQKPCSKAQCIWNKTAVFWNRAEIGKPLP